MKPEVILLYDGECPICREYKKYVELRKKVDLSIQDARQHPVLIEQLRSKGYDINQGMILIVNGEVYHRDQVIVMLGAMTEAKGILDVILRAFIRKPKLMKRIYPFLKGLRYCLLKMSGKDPFIG